MKLEDMLVLSIRSKICITIPVKIVIKKLLNNKTDNTTANLAINILINQQEDICFKPKSLIQLLLRISV